MKVGAISILTSMLMGLLAWGGSNIITNKTNIAKLDVREKNQSALLKEVRADVKLLIKRGY